jgi:uncharacterized protein
VNNITNFGCFVDIGVKKRFGSYLAAKQALCDVNEVVKHQHVEVKVTEVDEDEKRIQLTMVI